MLKIVYPICCGIDIHKTFVIACIASTNKAGITSYQSKRFSTFTKGLRELRQWLLSIIAICRMLLSAIYHILKKHEPYNPALYKKVELIPVSREITPEQAICIVQRQGYKIMAAT